MKSEKIVIITPHLNGGGAEKIALNLSNYYCMSGHTVELVMFEKKGKYLDLINKNVKIINLKEQSFIKKIFKLRKYLKNNENSKILSVIRISNIVVGIASIGLKNLKIVFREANTMDEIQKMNFLKKNIFKLLMKVSYKFANKIIANSDDTKKDLIEKRIIINKNKIIVIPNPVLPFNYKELSNEEIKHKWFDDSKLKVVLSVGRLVEQKNFSFLIDSFKNAFEINQNIRLMIVGEGVEKDRLENKIVNLGLSNYVEILDFKTNIYSYYKKADLFALSSKWEGFGNVLVEALSCGTPVVSTNCPGGPKMILENGKYGELVNLNDNKKFANSIIDILGCNIYNYKKLEDYATRFTVDNIAKLYLQQMDTK